MSSASPPLELVLDLDELPRLSVVQLPAHVHANEVRGGGASAWLARALHASCRHTPDAAEDQSEAAAAATAASAWAADARSSCIRLPLPFGAHTASSATSLTSDGGESAATVATLERRPCAHLLVRARVNKRRRTVRDVRVAGVVDRAYAASQPVDYVLRGGESGGELLDDAAPSGDDDDDGAATAVGSSLTRWTLARALIRQYCLEPNVCVAGAEAPASARAKRGVKRGAERLADSEATRAQRASSALPPPSSSSSSPPQQRMRPSHYRTQRIDFSAKLPFPPGPSPEDVRYFAQLEPALQSTLRELFARQPIWLKRGILLHIPRRFHPFIKRALPGVAYGFGVSGPWQHAWARYGYDPRREPSALPYQVVAFRVTGVARRNADAPASSGRARRCDDDGNDDDENGDDDDGVTFRHLPTQRNCFFRVCDVASEECRQIVRACERRAHRMQLELQRDVQPCGIGGGVGIGGEREAADNLEGAQLKCDVKYGWMGESAVKRFHEALRRHMQHVCERDGHVMK